jgi:hypothetical protein
MTKNANGAAKSVGEAEASTTTDVAPTAGQVSEPFLETISRLAAEDALGIPATDVAPTAGQVSEPFLETISRLAAEDHALGTPETWLACLIERAPEQAWELYKKAGLGVAATMIEDWKTVRYGMDGLDWAIETVRWVARARRDSSIFGGVVGFPLYQHSSADDEEPPPGAAYGESALDRLVEHVAAEMRAIAKIPGPEALDLTPWSFFETDLSDTFYGWAYSVAYDGGPPAKLLDEAKRDAVPLRAKLEKLHVHLNHAHMAFVREGRLLPWFHTLALCGCFEPGFDPRTPRLDPRTLGDFDFKLLRYLTPSGLAHVTKMVSAFIEAIERIRGEKTGGKPLGVKRYPGLDALVSDLEKLALLYGGKGFGLPSTRPQKGKIIRLLDKLRIYLKNDSELAWLMEFLPPPGKHPVSVYQRAIREARELHAEERERQAREAKTSEKSE